MPKEQAQSSLSTDFHTTSNSDVSVAKPPTAKPLFLLYSLYYSIEL